MVKKTAVKMVCVDYSKILLVLFLIIILIPIHALSDDSKEQKRPKIGLVLSGGGARGIAHIGVIKALEELKIPVDIIVGTSMGSIIGGLYASGMSLEELTKLVDLDWTSAFNDDPERENLRYRLKKDDDKYLLNYGIGFKKWKFLLPKGLIQGQSQIMILKGLTYDLYETDNFDDFPIQYRTVATDIESGEPVILKSGSLADAIRASMSVPGVFAPVEIDGKMLVDGGLTNNIPIDVAKELGADIIIAVDVGTPYVSGEELSSVLDITGQLSTFLVRKNSEEQIRKFKKDARIPLGNGPDGLNGVILQPELGDITSADFTKGHEAVEIGVNTTMQQKDWLETYSMQEEEYQDFLLKQRKPALSPISLDFIEIDNKSRLSSNVIRSFIHFEEGSILDVGKLEKDISNIYGLDIFERVEYHIVKRDDQIGLVIETVEKSWGPNYIGFGYNFYTNLNGSNEYSIGINLTRNPLNKYGGEWKNEFQFGEKDRVFSEYYQPLDRHMYYFVAPYVEFERQDIDIYESGHDVAKLRLRTYSAGLDVGRQLGHWGSVRVGARRTDGKTDVKVGDPGFGTYNYDRGGIAASFTYDTLDAIVFPNKGAKADISCDIDREFMGSDESLESYSLNLYGAKTWGRYTLSPGMTVDTVSHDDAPIQYASQTGGLFNLSGLIPNELMGLHSAVGRMILYGKVGKITKRPLYLGASLEYGNVWDDRDSISLDSGILAGSIFVGKDTFLGPIYLAYGMTEGGNNACYISVGQPYR